MNGDNNQPVFDPKSVVQSSNPFRDLPPIVIVGAPLLAFGALMYVSGKILKKR